MHALAALALAALVWIPRTQVVADRTFTTEIAIVDDVRAVSVELVTWEGPAFYSYEATACGSIIALGEAPTKDAAKRLGVAAVAAHRARLPRLTCAPLLGSEGDPDVDM